MTTQTSDIMAISGNTYPVKDQLKALGARWNGADKVWMIATERADEARAIVEAAGPAKPYAPRGGSYGARTKYRSNYTRFAGGGESYTNRGGRCIDAPCCGCCS